MPRRVELERGGGAVGMLSKGQTLLFPFPETLLLLLMITFIIIRVKIAILNIYGKNFFIHIQSPIPFMLKTISYLP